MPAPRAKLTSWWAVSVFDAALTVIPTFAAQLNRKKGTWAAKTVTPTVSATINLNPARTSASKTVTPTFGAAIVLHPGLLGSAHLTVAPTVSAVIGKIRPLSASLTVTPTISATLSLTRAATVPHPKQVNVTVSRAATI